MIALFLFQTTRDVIKAERLCNRHRLQCRIIPVPRHISSECGMSIETDESVVGEVEKLMKENGIVTSVYTDESGGNDK